MDNMKRGLLSLVLTVGGLMGLTPFSNIANAHAAEDVTASTDDAPEQFTAAGKWKYSASANCRCVDNSCKIISCSGESGVSYEDARFRAQISLEAQARFENGRIEGTPSISIRFESKFESEQEITDIVNAEQSQLTVFSYQIRYFNRGAVVHEERWETVAPNPQYAAAYASNHSMVMSQRLRERGQEVDRTSAVVTGTRPY